MITLIFDIDNTLVDMWPVERSCLEAMLGKKIQENVKQIFSGDLYAMYCSLATNKVSKREFRDEYKMRFDILQRTNRLPEPAGLQAVNFVKKFQGQYEFIFATGAWLVEIKYALNGVGIFQFFDVQPSIYRDNCRFSKMTGLPFRCIKKQVGGKIMLITDSKSDIIGADKANICSLLLRPNQKLDRVMIQKALASV